MSDKPGRIEGIKACVFDAYGTLFDVHSAVGKHRQRLGDKADTVSATWRVKQLEYTWLRSLMREYTDFWAVTGDALDYALDTASLNDNSLREDLMQAYLQLDPYPEVKDVLQQLQQAGIPCAILTNGSPAMIDAAIKSAGLTDLLQHALSVESVRIFKPDPSVYQLAVDTLQVKPEEICFQSSNSWDAVGAANFGFRVAWINRFGQRRERLPAQPDAELDSLNPLPGLLAATG